MRKIVLAILAMSVMLSAGGEIASLNEPVVYQETERKMGYIGVLGSVSSDPFYEDYGSIGVLGGYAIVDYLDGEVRLTYSDFFEQLNFQILARPHFRFIYGLAGFEFTDLDEDNDPRFYEGATIGVAADGFILGGGLEVMGFFVEGVYTDRNEQAVANVGYRYSF